MNEYGINELQIINDKLERICKRIEFILGGNAFYYLNTELKTFDIVWSRKIHERHKYYYMNNFSTIYYVDEEDITINIINEIFKYFMEESRTDKDRI